MVLLNASTRARNVGQTITQCLGGGNKKYGLIPRENQPAAVALAHKSHYKSHPETVKMATHQMWVTGGMGIGRKLQTLRHSAWNTNGTSASVSKASCAAKFPLQYN